MEPTLGGVACNEKEPTSEAGAEATSAAIMIQKNARGMLGRARMYSERDAVEARWLAVLAEVICTKRVQALGVAVFIYAAGGVRLAPPHASYAPSADHCQHCHAS